MTRARLYKSELVEAATAPPAADLRRYVAGYTAWRDLASYAMRRRHVPSGRVALIVNLDTRVRQFDARRPEPAEHQTFTSGLYDGYTISESAGRGSGVQVDFTALGARLFYGRPLEALANRSVALEDMLGADAERLAGRLFAAPVWEECFDVLDREIRARVFRARSVKPEVSWAWHRLTLTAGSLPIAALADELGWSTRHLATRFQAEFGMRPKTFARVLRFSRAVGAMSRRGGSTLADVAAEAGYFDQAHFNRDVTAFSGLSPGMLLEAERAVLFDRAVSPADF